MISVNLEHCKYENEHRNDFEEEAFTLNISVDESFGGKGALQSVYFNRDRLNNVLYTTINNDGGDMLENFKNEVIRSISNEMFFEVWDIGGLYKEYCEKYDGVGWVDTLRCEIEGNVLNDVTTLVLGTGDLVYDRELHLLMKQTQRCNIHFLLGVDNGELDEDGKLTKYNLRELNNPFVVQSVVYIDNPKERVYNLDSLYRGANRSRVVR